MEEEKIRKLYQLINEIPVTEENEDLINEIKGDLTRKKLYSSIRENKNT